MDNTVIEQQPSRFGEERHGTCADFRTLPGTVFKRSYFHHTAVFTPIFHVGTVADVDVAERCVPVVAGTAQHGVFAVYLLWKQYAVAVERQEGVFALEEFFEVERIPNTDGWSVVSVTPGNPVTVDIKDHRIRVTYTVQYYDVTKAIGGGIMGALGGTIPQMSHEKWGLETCYPFAKKDEHKAKKTSSKALVMTHAYSNVIMDKIEETVKNGLVGNENDDW